MFTRKFKLHNNLDKNRIGFIQFNENRIGSNFCEAGRANITKVDVDQNNANILYASTETGDIIMFEASYVLNRPDKVDCKSNEFGI